MPAISTHLHTLSNGLRVVTCPMPNTGLVTVHVHYHVGSYHERPSQTGLAHLFEHLMFDNTSTGIEKHYDVFCTRAGGTNNAYTTYDQTAYHITLPSHQLDLGLWLEAERMRDFQITPQALAVQQSVVIEEIKQNVEGQPYGRVWEAMDRTAYANTSHYSWNVYGDPQHIAKVTIDDARSFFEHHYRPEHAVLVVAGNVTPDETHASVERYFGAIPRGASTRDQIEFREEHRTTGGHTVVPDNVPAPAVYAFVHLPGLHDDTLLDADLLARILGGGNSSVLYHDLVHTERIATYAGAFVDRRAHSSLLILYAYAIDDSITADHLYTSLQASVTNASINQQNIEKAINQQRTSLAMELQRGHNVANEIAYYTTFFNDPSLINTLIDRYTDRTIDTVTAVTNSIKELGAWGRIDIVPNKS